MLFLAAGVQAVGGMILWFPAQGPASQVLARLVGFCLIAIPLFVLFAVECPRDRDDYAIGIVRLFALGWITAGAALLGMILIQKIFG